NLSHNELVGSINGIYSLRQLDYLDFSYNQFSGTIVGSGVSLLRRLKSLGLKSNSLSGAIPGSISSLSNINAL
ncbi:unnamed protein product, partial [Closterium sp. Yama58-4]